ncbi:MAG: hypothetical protein Q4C96_03900 [Planctomycetia bacterium]|nr:hypothetical protein [Planctomycetia bacterium]
MIRGIRITLLLLACLGMLFFFYNYLSDQRDTKKQLLQVKEMDQLLIEAGKALQSKQEEEFKAILPKIDAILQQAKSPLIKIRYTPSLSELYQLAGDKEKSLACLEGYDELIQQGKNLIKDKNEEYHLYVHYFMVANRYVFLDKKDRAEKILGELAAVSLEEYPDTTKARYFLNLAQGYAFLNQADKTENYIQQVLNIFDKVETDAQPFYLHEIAEIHFRLKNFDQATKDLDQLEKLIKEGTHASGDNFIRNIELFRKRIHTEVTGEELPPKSAEDISLDNI